MVYNRLTESTKEEEDAQVEKVYSHPQHTSLRMCILSHPILSAFT